LSKKEKKSLAIPEELGEHRHGPGLPRGDSGRTKSRFGSSVLRLHKDLIGFPLKGIWQKYQGICAKPGNSELGNSSCGIASRESLRGIQYEAGRDGFRALVLGIVVEKGRIIFRRAGWNYLGGPAGVIRDVGQLCADSKSS